VDNQGNCCVFFSIRLDKDMCNLLGANSKETIIYELEMLASCLALDLWASCLASAYPVLYGDNDSVRFALIRGTGLGLVANTIMQQHLETEVNFNTNVWFARVPTQANLADILFCFLSHHFLPSSLDESSKAWTCLERFFETSSTCVRRGVWTWGRRSPHRSPCQKEEESCRCCTETDMTMKLLKQDRIV